MSIAAPVAVPPHALFTRMSMGPSAACTELTTSRIALESQASAMKAKVWLPDSSAITFAVCVTFGEMSMSTTDTPSRAKRLAIASPTPDADPVTSAVRFLI